MVFIHAGKYSEGIFHQKNIVGVGWWWCVTLIPELRKQREVDL